MTAITDDTVLKRVHQIFAARALIGDKTPMSGYGNSEDNCCLTGAVYFVCTDGAKTYDAELEAQTTAVGPTRSAYESAITRLYDALDADERGEIETLLQLVLYSASWHDFRELTRKCRVLEKWYDTKATHTSAAELAARA